MFGTGALAALAATFIFLYEAGPFGVIARLRDAIGSVHPALATLVGCNRCSGFWFGVVFGAVAWFVDEEGSRKGAKARRKKGAVAYVADKDKEDGSHEGTKAQRKREQRKEGVLDWVVDEDKRDGSRKGAKAQRKKGAVAYVADKDKEDGSHEGTKAQRKREQRKKGGVLGMGLYMLGTVAVTVLGTEFFLMARGAVAALWQIAGGVDEEDGDGEI